MDQQSPFLSMQRVEGHIKALLRTLDVDMLELGERKAALKLKRLAIDARLDIRDYELSETREEQVQNAVDARNRLYKLQSCILAVGPTLGPADVAQLSATIDDIHGRLL